MTGDEKALTAAPGIGKKIAQRIILELKDKLAKEQTSFSSDGPVPVIAAGGANKAGEVFEFHPMTGKRIPGTQIPYWEEVKAMCLKAMHVVPQVRFVAWDVAITPDGPVFIEGNSFPSHAIPQFAAHFPDGIGILPRFEAFIDL